ncbi:MAG TPA: hypothetical protein VLF93_08030 [Candidatus Saccharimonadales bacterium]|nr:hypothetical protein [Candidatus Saccharimonadales bacterium]
MNDIVNQLTDFIEIAKKNRKYPSGTAIGRSAALNLFAQELNEQERNSIETFKNNFDQIYQSVYNKNKSKMSIESLETYKGRINKLIKDYEEYGVDPSKLANWNRPARKVRQSASISKKNKKSGPVDEEKNQTNITNNDLELSRYELPLRPGTKAIILIPSDITKSEVSKLKKYFDFVESIAIADEQHIQVDEGK